MHVVSASMLNILLVELVAYVVGCFFCFFVLDRITRTGRPMVPVSYSHRKLQLIGMSLIWPLLIALLPAAVLCLIVWMFFKAYRVKH